MDTKRKNQHRTHDAAADRRIPVDANRPADRPAREHRADHRKRVAAHHANQSRSRTRPSKAAPNGARQSTPERRQPRAAPSDSTLHKIALAEATAAARRLLALAEAQARDGQPRLLAESPFPQTTAANRAHGRVGRQNRRVSTIRLETNPTGIVEPRRMETETRRSPNQWGSIFTANRETTPETAIRAATRKPVSNGYPQHAKKEREILRRLER